MARFRELTPGFFPSNPFSSSPGGGPDLRDVRLSFRQLGDNRFLLSALRLDPQKIYRLESASELPSFTNSQNFTGRQVMNGIVIETDEPRKFFRLSAIP